MCACLGKVNLQSSICWKYVHAQRRLYTLRNAGMRVRMPKPLATALPLLLSHASLRTRPLRIRTLWYFTPNMLHAWP